MMCLLDKEAAHERPAEGAPGNRALANSLSLSLYNAYTTRLLDKEAAHERPAEGVVDEVAQRRAQRRARQAHAEAHRHPKQRPCAAAY